MTGEPRGDVDVAQRVDGYLATRVMTVARVDELIRRCQRCLEEHNSPVIDGLCQEKIDRLLELRTLLVQRKPSE